MELPWFLLFMSLHYAAVDAYCGLSPGLPPFDEGARNGDAVYNITATENIWLVSGGRGYFNISDNTLYAAKDLDMSKDKDLCATSVFTLQIECQSIKNKPVDRVVILNALDRHPPQFPKSYFSKSIPETTWNGTEVFDFSSSNETRAVDEDCVDQDLLYYSVDSNPFVDISNANLGKVITIATFDYESGQNSHSVIIYVTSGAKIGTARFTLNINDVDDEDPIFTNDIFILKVEEGKSYTQPMNSTPPISAYDQDIGINTPLGYSIRNSTPAPDLTINGDTGMLSLNQTLDRETHDSYKVILETYQLDNKLRTATATLSILVQDINDNRPAFTPTTYTASIQEHSAEGSNIIRVTAVDVDEDPNNLFNYTLVPESDVFQIDPQTGYLQVRNSTILDRETQDNITVTVTAIESVAQAPGSPDCQTVPDCSASVLITLLDINDHSPVFVGAPYSFSSSNEAGDQLGTVTATDDDIGDNGRVTYSIQHSDFSVNETTGRITQVNTVVNQLEETFLVQACDNGQSRRCSSVLVTVMFPDQNVTSTKRTVNVTENVAVGTIVYTIPIAYRGYVLNLTSHRDTFRIVEQDSVSQVLTAADIDRENTTSYTLVIDVITGSTSEANITLNVVVLDVNDNAPIFNMSDYSFSVSVDAKIGDVLGVVTAYDLDEGSNGVVTFNIQGTESSRRFDIEGNTGKITFKIVPESPTEVLVVATDGGVLPLKTTTAVKVVISGAQNAYTLFHAPAGKDDIEKEKDWLAGQISAILNISIGIGNIVDVDNGASSYFRLTATEATVHPDDLRAKVNNNYDSLLALFSHYQNKSEEVFTTPFIALLAAAIAVVLISVIVIIAIVRINRKRQRNHERLVHNLSRKDTIYETQAVEEETVEDRQSVHSQTGSTQGLLGAAQQPNGDVVAVINEGFVEDDNNNDNRTGDENQDTVTQYTHIEDETEGREITEGVIVDLSSEDVPEPEHMETQSHPNPDYGDGEEEIPNPDYAVVVKEVEPETQTAVMAIEDEEPDENVDNLIDDDKDEVVPSQILEPYEESAGAPTSEDRHDEDSPDVVDEAPAEDDADSSDGVPPPPPTPPRVRKSDPEDEEPFEAQDEPEPDYAKKVRFSEVRVQVIPDPKDEDAVDSGVVGGTEGAETDEEDHTTKSDRPFEEIQNPAEDIDEDDDGTFIMTSL